MLMTTTGTWAKSPSSFSYAWYVTPSDVGPQIPGKVPGTEATLHLRWPAGAGWYAVAVTAPNAAGSSHVRLLGEMDATGSAVFRRRSVSHRRAAAFFQAELALREMDAPSISNVSVCLRRLSLERVTRVSSGESPTVRTARSESSSDGVATWK